MLVLVELSTFHQASFDEEESVEAVEDYSIVFAIHYLKILVNFLIESPFHRNLITLTMNFFKGKYEKRKRFNHETLSSVSLKSNYSFDNIDGIHSI